MEPEKGAARPVSPPDGPGSTRGIVNRRNLGDQPNLPGGDERHTLKNGWVGANKPQELLLEHALWFTRHGWPVMPLERLGKIAHKRLLGSGWHHTDRSPGSHCETQIREWWKLDPFANIGIQAGRLTIDGIRLVMLDVDRKLERTNGYESLIDLQEEYGEEIPAGGEHTESTPSGGGAHIWFQTNADDVLRKRDNWLPGVDVIALGALSVVGPSGRQVNISDRRDGPSQVMLQYVWQAKKPLPARELPRMPKWLLDDIRSRPATPRSAGIGDLQGGLDGPRQAYAETRLPPTSEFRRRGFGIFTGNRNPDCYRLACRLWGAWAFEVDPVMTILREVWFATPGHDLEPPDGFPWREVVGCAKSAFHWMSQQKSGSA